MITFKGKYGSLPGDFNRASIMVSPDAFNGDNNGEIDRLAPPNAHSNALNEELFMWQHLGLAKLIKGSYNGLYHDVKKFSDIGNNSPLVAGFDSATILPRYHTGAPLYGHAGGHFFMVGVGSSDLGSAGMPIGGVMTASDAKQIDDKLDDGVALTGMVNATNGLTGTAVHTGCLDNNTLYYARAGAGNYDLTTGKKTCMMVKWTNF
jgi:hypothetical protein